VRRAATGMSNQGTDQDVIELSSCHDVHEGQLVRLRPPTGAVDPLAEFVHSQLRALLLHRMYPCLGGTSAIRTGTYRLGLYARIGSADAVRDCTEDLHAFLADNAPDIHPIAVFIAVFDGPVFPGETGFERALWRQLQAMHRADAAAIGVLDPEPITVDEADAGFIFGDRNFFVVGLHPAASRWARRFGWPTLVFNALTHDALLRSRGQYERMQGTIRRRDARLQGAVNPAVDLPQVAQFAGRSVGNDWQCPGWSSPRGR
jgi:uncharacterized protein